MRAVWALKSEYTRRAKLTMAEAMDTAFSPMRVSDRTRLAAEKAAWNNLLSAGPVLPASWATRYASFN